MVEAPVLGTDGKLRVPQSPMTYQDSVKGRRRPTPLHVPQDSDPGVISQTLNHQLKGQRERQSRGEESSRDPDKPRMTQPLIL